MPNKDKTGPSGQGPMTGRGLGLCRDGTPRRMGRGFGRCCRRIISTTPENEKRILESELKQLDLEKQEIEDRLKEL